MFRLLFQIMTPMAVPAIATVSVFIFVYTWNEFLWPLLIAQSTAMYTLPVGLATLGTDINIRFGPVMAANVIAGLPVFIVYLFYRRISPAGSQLNQNRSCHNHGYHTPSRIPSAAVSARGVDQSERRMDLRP
ncbi:MAG: ABC transporter permease subunit [Spirochaetia bacterium]